MVSQRISVSGLTGGIFAPPIGTPPQILPFCIHRHPHFVGHKLHGRRRLSFVEPVLQGTHCTLQPDVPTGPVLEACIPEAEDALRADLLLVKEEINKGVVPSRTRSDERCFRKWEIFSRAHNMDTFLDKVRDPVLFLKNLPAGLEAAYLLTTVSQYAHVLLRRTFRRLVRRSPTWLSGNPASTSTGAYTTVFNDS